MEQEATGRSWNTGSPTRTQLYSIDEYTLEQVAQSSYGGSLIGVIQKPGSNPELHALGAHA